MKLSNILKTMTLVTPLIWAQYACSENSEPKLEQTAPILQSNIDKALHHLDIRAVELLNITGVPGMAIAVVQDGRVIFAKGFGLRQVGSDLKVNPDTVFQLASMSKSIGATVVAAAVSQGTVRWNDPVVNYLNDFELANPDVAAKVTIADMYAHRSGLPEYAGDDLEDLGYKRMEIIKRLKYLPLDPFLTSYHYANYDVTTAAQAVATASKLPWEDLSKKMLYEPLGMTSTSSKWLDYDKATNKAALHIKNSDGKWVSSARLPDEQSPAAGVSTSVNDLSKWMILQLNEGAYQDKQLISKDAILAMRHLPDNVRPLLPEKGEYYGLGMRVRTDEKKRIRLFHAGHFSFGASTIYDLLPSAKLGIVVLTNGLATNPKAGIVVGVPETITQEFYDIVEYGRLPYNRNNKIVAELTHKIPKLNSGKPSGKSSTVRPALASQMTRLTGTYSNDYFGPITVKTVDKDLQFTMGPDNASFLLRYRPSSNTFAFITPGGRWDEANSLKFKPASKSAPAKIIIDVFNKNGLGTFHKVPSHS